MVFHLKPENGLKAHCLFKPKRLPWKQTCPGRILHPDMHHIICTYLLVALSILLRSFKEFKMQQPYQYLKHPDLSTSQHSSRTFTDCMSIGEPYTRLLHYVILHYLALVLNTCLILLVCTPLLNPCAFPQILIS